MRKYTGGLTIRLAQNDSGQWIQRSRLVSQLMGKIFWARAVQMYDGCCSVR